MQFVHIEDIEVIDYPWQCLLLVMLLFFGGPEL